MTVPNHPAVWAGKDTAGEKSFTEWFRALCRRGAVTSFQGKRKAHYLVGFSVELLVALTSTD